jgi:hypothetical protein
MPVHKRKYQSGSTSWYFKFQPPGAMRGTSTIRGFGFATKGEAQTAERKRRTEEEQKYELAKAAAIVGPVPQTLAMLLEEFFRQHVDQKLAPKTCEPVSRAGGVPRSRSAQHAHRGDYTAPSQPGME